jgi:hypothetical protein
MASPFLLKVTEYFTKQNKVSRSGSSIKIGSITYTARQFNAMFLKNESRIAEYVGMGLFYSKIEENKDGSRFTKDSDVISELANTVFHDISKKLTKDAKETITGDVDIIRSGYKYHGMVPVLDRGSKSFLLFDTVNKCIDEGTSYAVWEKYVSKQPKEVKEMMNTAVMVAEVMYNPFTDLKAELTKVNNQEDVLTINAHQMPKWREAPNEIENPVLPELFKKLMDFMFLV